MLKDFVYMEIYMSLCQLPVKVQEQCVLLLVVKKDP